MALTALSCDTYPPSEPFTESEVPGRYVAHFHSGQEYIDLKSDSIYSHFYRSPDGSEYYDSGSWRLIDRSIREEGYEGYYRIRLTDFVTRYPVNACFVYDPESGRVDTLTQLLSFTFKKKDGKLRIVRHPVYENEYVKE
jgi:hypothetical protein